MDDPERDRPEDGLGSFPRYPAPGRPEQPMAQKPSAWPWVLGGAVLTVVALAAIGVLIIVLVLDALSSR